MIESTSALSSWESFYVIVGSSGGALLVSAIMSAPWPSLVPLSLAIGACGLGGLVYGAIVMRRARRQDDYEPVWEDWLWHTVFPFACYAGLTVGAVLLRPHPQRASFVVGSGGGPTKKD